MPKKHASEKQFSSVNLLPHGYDLIPAAARQVGYSTNYVRDLVQEGRVPGKKIGTQWVVEIKSLKAFKQTVKRGRPAHPTDSGRAS